MEDSTEHNKSIFKEIAKLEAKIVELKSQMKPIELPKQASLNDCNALARKAKTVPLKINPKLVAEEAGFKHK